jgi:hypothetical protein
MKYKLSISNSTGVISFRTVDLNGENQEKEERFIKIKAVEAYRDAMLLEGKISTEGRGHP